MNFPASEPLCEADLEFLDEVLLKYGNDHSILTVSELDGFLTAIVSGPETVLPSRWLPAIWAAGNDVDAQPNWQSEAEFSRFMSLVMQHMNGIVAVLMHEPDQFQALFMQSNPERTGDKTPVVIAEEWCFGFMRGVELGKWPELPEDTDRWLQSIRLHGTEEGFDVLGSLSLAEHQKTVAEIEPAASKLHAYWLAQRSPVPPQGQANPWGDFAPPAAMQPFGMPAPQSPFESAPKTGRNAPCPCGSGKKFKQCCLH